MPSRRFWAKNNPAIVFKETVTKTNFFIDNYKYKKFIHISSVSARCQLNTVYGKNKKKSEDLVAQDSNNLILRLGPLYGEGLKKGVLIDMVNSKTVFINGNSKYSFTNINWVCEWIISKMNIHKGIKEIGSQDYLTLSDIAKKIKSKSKFEGEIDDQIILDNEIYDSKSFNVYDYLKNFQLN